MKPPWRTARPEEKGRYIRLAIAGFVAVWIPMAATMIVGLLAFGRPKDQIENWSDVSSLLLVFTFLVDVAALVIGFQASSGTTRSLGWGVFVALLTHTIFFVLSFGIIFFGWCVASYP